VPRPSSVQRPVQRPASSPSSSVQSIVQRPVHRPASSPASSERVGSRGRRAACGDHGALLGRINRWLLLLAVHVQAQGTQHTARSTQHAAHSIQHTASPARLPARDPARRANTVGGCTRARSVPHCSRVSSCLGRGSSRRDAPAARSTHGLSGWAGVIPRRRRDLWAGCKWALGTGHADAQPPTPLALEGPRGARHSSPVITLPDRSRRRGSQQPITLPNTQ
jgi:hypothetical protein